MYVANFVSFFLSVLVPEDGGGPRVRGWNSSGTASVQRLWRALNEFLSREMVDGPLAVTSLIVENLPFAANDLW